MFDNFVEEVVIPRKPSTTKDTEKQALQEKEQHLEVVTLDDSHETTGPKTIKQWLKTPDLYIVSDNYVLQHGYSASV